MAAAELSIAAVNGRFACSPSADHLSWRGVATVKEWKLEIEEVSFSACMMNAGS